MSKAKQTPKTPAKAEPKSKSEATTPKLTRYELAAVILTEGKRTKWTVEELAAEEDKRHVADGGTDNYKEALFSAKRVSSILEAIKLIAVTDGAIEVIGKVVSK